MLPDPFPGRELLTAAQVRKLLGLTNLMDWKGFLAEPPATFPQPVALGKTAGGKPRERYKKRQILAYIELLR